MALQAFQGPQRLQKFWDLLHARHSIRNCNRMLYGDQTRFEEIFAWSTTSPAPAKSSGDTRDLFAVANLQIKSNQITFICFSSQYS